MPILASLLQRFAETKAENSRAVVLQSLFISSRSVNGIDEYSGSGKFIRHFVPEGSGRLNAPGQTQFGPDGNLYVADACGLKKYHGTTGSFLGDVTAVPFVCTGFTFDVSGNLYAIDRNESRIMKLDAQTGKVLQSYQEGLQKPSALAIRPNGSLLVADSGRECLLALDTANGATRICIPNVRIPIGLCAAEDGRLYITDLSGVNIKVVNVHSGTAQVLTQGNYFHDPRYVAYISGLLFVTDYANGTESGAVQQFDARTGEQLDSFHVTAPVGIAVRPPAR